MKICLDIGYTGEYAPRVCEDGQTELDICVEIVNFLSAELQNSGHEVVFTREDTGSCKDDISRINIANAHKGDYLLSIQCNSIGSQKVRGAEIVYSSGNLKGELLAHRIQKKLRRLNYTEDVGIRNGHFLMLQLAQMPAVLVQCRYITSTEESIILSDIQWQKKIAEAIAESL